MKNLNYVIVIGYSRSGSSACTNLLKEFEGFHAVDGEFRIAKDPYGLLDLENALVHNWDVMRNDIAIRDFFSYCDMFSRSPGLFKKTGKGFSNKLNVDVMNLAENYINSLVDMVYFGNSAVHRYYSSALKLFISTIKSKFGKNNAIQTYCSKPSEDVFIKMTRQFIDNLFANHLNDETTIILDQAMSPTNIANTIKYFHSSKVIVMDRDPRDIYSNLSKNGTLIGSDLSSHDSVDKYVKWHNILRSNLESEIANKELSKNVLRLNFEDLVLNYVQSVEKITNFLGGNIVHKNQSVYFNPKGERSKKSVELRKKYPDQRIMDEILDKLPQYCNKTKF